MVINTNIQNNLNQPKLNAYHKLKYLRFNFNEEPS